jgi:hypothetical protein
MNTDEKAINRKDTKSAKKQKRTTDNTDFTDRKFIRAHP